MKLALLNIASCLVAVNAIPLSLDGFQQSILNLNIPKFGDIKDSIPLNLPEFLNFDKPEYPNEFNDKLMSIESFDKLPEIDTEQLQSLIKAEDLKQGAESLYNISLNSVLEYGNPTRVIGSPGHWGTIGYIIDEIRKLGGYYKVKTQRFNAIDGKVNSFSLLIDGVQPKSLEAFSMTPATPDLSVVHGDLILVDGYGCSLLDFPNDLTKDNIVLIKRGECPFGDKSNNAGKRGAKGAIIYDSNGSLLGTLGTPQGNEVPTLGVSEKDVKSYIDKLIEDPSYKFETSLFVDAYVRNISTLNVIAETAHGDHDNVVSLGAHSDSVGAGPGINDDGSGSISLLTVAKQLTNFKVNNAVRFAWWSAEEEGLLGSTAYAESLDEAENSKLRLFMDYDMMASPNYEYQVYDANNKDHPNGSGDLKQLYIDWYLEHGLNYTLVPFDGRSDYVGFIDVDIPAGGIATGAEGVKTQEGVEKFGGKAGQWFDPCYHQLCDDLQNPDYEAWVINTQLISHSIAVYAKTFEGFPERSTSKVESKSQPQFQLRGSKFIY